MELSFNSVHHRKKNNHEREDNTRKKMCVILYIKEVWLREKQFSSFFPELFQRQLCTLDSMY